MAFTADEDAIASRDTDFSTQSNPADVKIEHLQLNLEVDFAGKTLSGEAIYTVSKKRADVEELVLDTNGLDVAGVKIDYADTKAWRWGMKHKVFGHSLHIALPKDKCMVAIAYKTRDTSSACDWTAPGVTTT